MPIPNVICSEFVDVTSVTMFVFSVLNPGQGEGVEPPTEESLSICGINYCPGVSEQKPAQ